MYVGGGGEGEGGGGEGEGGGSEGDGGGGLGQGWATVAAARGGATRRGSDGAGQRASVGGGKTKRLPDPCSTITDPALHSPACWVESSKTKVK